MPTTYDELYEVLKAFKEKDPDGNGKNDIYGLAAGVSNGFPFIALMASMKAGHGSRQERRPKQVSADESR